MRESSGSVKKVLTHIGERERGQNDSCHIETSYCHYIFHVRLTPKFTRTVSVFRILFDMSNVKDSVGSAGYEKPEKKSTNINHQ